MDLQSKSICAFRRYDLQVVRFSADAYGLQALKFQRLKHTNLLPHTSGVKPRPPKFQIFWNGH